MKYFNVLLILLIFFGCSNSKPYDHNVNHPELLKICMNQLDYEINFLNNLEIELQKHKDYVKFLNNEIILKNEEIKNLKKELSECKKIKKKR